MIARLNYANQLLPEVLSSRSRLTAKDVFSFEHRLQLASVSAVLLGDPGVLVSVAKFETRSVCAITQGGAASWPSNLKLH